MNTSIPDDHEFEQMLAEAKHRLGKHEFGCDLMREILKSTAAEFGWPLSSEGKKALLFRLATSCLAVESLWQ